MKISADIYVKDVPGTLVSSLEPISTLGGNIVGVVHNREQIISGRISVNVVFDMDKRSLEALKKEWKSRDIIIADFGEDYEIVSMDYMLIGNLSAAYIENLIKRASRIVELESVDMGYSSKLNSGSRTAMISANLRSKDDIYKLSDFLAGEAKDADLTFIMGVL
jgi:ACT domain-containing protein